MRTHPWLTRLLLPALLLFAPGHAPALEVQSHFFGFDGTAAPGRVSMLSVQLVNASSQVYDGPVAVSTAGAMGGVNGVPQEINVFLAPGASRWIQTPVLVDPSSYFDGGVLVEWDLDSPFRGSQKLDAPKAGPPATVYLSDEGNPLAARPRVQAFQDNLWPTSLDPVAGGLHAVVMDHAPRWEAIREQVFMDWLRLGGVVHLLHGTDDRPPVFSGALTPLNDPAESFRIGAGRVHRHARGPGGAARGRTGRGRAPWHRPVSAGAGAAPCGNRGPAHRAIPRLRQAAAAAPTRVRASFPAWPRADSPCAP